MLLVVWVYLTNKIQLHKVVLGQRRSNLAFASDWSYFGRQNLVLLYFVVFRTSLKFLQRSFR